MSGFGTWMQNTAHVRLADKLTNSPLAGISLPRPSEMP
jgi:hypothetical protein